MSLAVIAALTNAACGDPPDKELQEARTAIDAARSAGADVYAREEFTAAETALKNAADAVDQRDYRLALNRALDARERAQTATKEAATRKSAVRADASRALAATTAALTQARTKLKAAESARTPARALAPARRTIDDCDRALQETRTAFGQGAYAGVIESAGATTTRLRGVSHDLDALSSAAPRRRR